MVNIFLIVFSPYISAHFSYIVTYIWILLNLPIEETSTSFAKNKPKETMESADMNESSF